MGEHTCRSEYFCLSGKKRARRKVAVALIEQRARLSRAGKGFSGLCLRRIPEKGGSGEEVVLDAPTHLEIPVGETAHRRKRIASLSTWFSIAALLPTSPS